MAFGQSRQGGTYRRTKEEYPIMEVLALSVAVDRVQGFVKSKQGFYDEASATFTADNRAAVLNSLRRAANIRRTTNEMYEATGSALGYSINEDIPDFEVTEDDRLLALEIYNYFDQILLLDKMSDALVKRGRDGQVNDYNEQLARIFDSGECDTNKELAMLVSLPNSRRIAVKREEMDAFYASHQTNGYIGELKKRVKVSGKVMDVKFIPKHNLHLATVVTAEGKLAKFFMNDKLSDLATSIRDSDITFVGTVKKHDVNHFTKCQETMFNRLKIEGQ